MGTDVSPAFGHAHRSDVPLWPDGFAPEGTWGRLDACIAMCGMESP